MLKLIVLGGPVMIPLLLCSVLALAISIDRLWYLLRSRVDSEDLMEDIRLALEQGKVLEAMQIAKRTRGPVAAVLAAGIAITTAIKKKSQRIWKWWARKRSSRWSGG